MQPSLGIVHSPRSDWSSRLQRHLANHGGARVKRMILEPRVALEEDFDVLVCDDTTSFLSPSFVDRVRARGVRMLGVYARSETAGRDRLVALGFDGVVDADAEAVEFVSEITRLAPASTPAESAGVDATTRAGRAPGAVKRVVVGGAAGGCGTTEVSIGLADALAARALRGRPVVLFDADDVSPALPVRLNLPIRPNIRNAIDACEHGLGALDDILQSVDGGDFRFLAGLPRSGDWPQLRLPEVTSVIDHLVADGGSAVISVGYRREDLTRLTGLDRYGLTRAMYSAADVIVGVGAPTPTGVVRLLDWVADMGDLASGVPLHLVIGRAPRAKFKQAEIGKEILRSVGAASLTFAPADRRVEKAEWMGTVVGRGPFVRAMTQLARSVVNHGTGEPSVLTGLDAPTGRRIAS